LRRRNRGKYKELRVEIEMIEGLDVWLSGLCVPCLRRKCLSNEEIGKVFGWSIVQKEHGWVQGAESGDRDDRGPKITFSTVFVYIVVEEHIE
jgi:hypothetical protein